MPPSSSEESGEGSVSAAGLFPEDQISAARARGQTLEISLRSDFLSYSHHSSCLAYLQSGRLSSLFITNLPFIPLFLFLGRTFAAWLLFGRRPLRSRSAGGARSSDCRSSAEPADRKSTADSAQARFHDRARAGTPCTGRRRWRSGCGSRSDRRGFSQCPDSARISPVRRSSAPAMPLPPGRSATCRR